MKYNVMLNKIQQLEKITDKERYLTILQWLEAMNIKPEIQTYKTGKNIIVPTTKKRYIGVASHFDTVPRTPGANDNGSAIAVCLEILQRLQAHPLKNIGVKVFFFDQEEVGLLGSKAYLKENGVEGLIGLFNMEMVGMGNQFALWPLDETKSNLALDTFEQIAQAKNIRTTRLDRIVMNSADHESFRNFGFEEAFTISVISDEDLAVAYHYYQAMEMGGEMEVLWEILTQAPIFKHYHRPTDFSIHLSEEALQMTADVIWETIVDIDNMLHALEQ